MTSLNKSFSKYICKKKYTRISKQKTNKTINTENSIHNPLISKTYSCFRVICVKPRNNR